MARRRYPADVKPARARAAIRAGEKAGRAFQEQFDRTGGRERKLPKPPYEDEALADLWQSGFDSTTEEARQAMTCADCGEDLKLYEEQICTRCLEKHEAA
jgi:hypothetical protein